MQYRRIRREKDAGIAPAVLIGVGLGLALGFLAGELFAGEGRRAVSRVLLPWKKRPKARPSVSDLTDALQQTLAKVLGQDAQSLALVPVGRNAFELHGWATSRASRTRALQATRDALDPSIKLVDRLLVWGEDDAPTPVIPLRGEPESA